MKNIKVAMASCSLILAAVGCGNNNSVNDQTSTAPENSDKKPEYQGSATDIIPQNGNNTNAVNTADNGLGGPMQRASGNYQSQPVASNTADSEIASKIKVALTTGSTGTTGVIAENQLTKIDVTVRNGVVTLRGEVSSEKEKEIIEKQVSGMEGVQSVDNQLVAGGRNVQDIPLQPLVPRSPENP